jgi:hypothetical protein
MSKLWTNRQELDSLLWPLCRLITLKPLHSATLSKINAQQLQEINKAQREYFRGFVNLLVRVSNRMTDNLRY